MPSIADLFISVTSDVSSAIKGLTDVDQKVNGTSAAMAAAAPAGYALAGAAAAVGGAFLLSVSQAADFEKQINGIKAVMSPTEVVQFGDAIRDLALALGKDTVFTSAQAAAAIEEMIKVGIPLEAILAGGARSALDLASATGANVVDAAKLASTAMNAFHLDASKLPGVMDAISNISNSTATSVNGLSLAISDVGPIANQLGLTFEDTALAIGVFASNGLTANTAGTALKTMLSGLTPATKEQNALFWQLGLTTEEGGNQFFDATGKVKSMSEVAEILKTALANLTPVQRATTLETLFGRDGMVAASIAASEGAAGFDKYAAAADKMGGTTLAAAQRNAGLTGSMNQLGGSFEAVQIQVGTLFLPVLTQLADMLTTLLNGFLTLDPGVQTAIVAVVGIAGAAAGLLAGFILLGPVLGAVGAAFGIIAGAAATVALPIVALVAAGVLLYEAWQTNFGGIRDVTEQVGIAIQPALQNIQDFIALLAANLGPALTGIQAALQPFITALSNDLTPILAGIPPLIRLIGDGFNALSPIVQSIWAIFQLLITGDFTGGIFGLDEDSGVVVFFIKLHDAIALFFDAVLKLLNGDFAGAWNSLWGSFTTTLEAVATGEAQLLQLIGEQILGFLQAIPGWVAENVPGMWQALLDEFVNLPGQLAPAWDAFAGWFGSVLGGMPQFVSDNTGDVWFPLRLRFQDLLNIVIPAWNDFAEWFGSVLGGITQFVGDMAGDIWAALRAAFDGLVDQLAPAWDAFAGWLGAVLGGIGQFVADNIGDVFGSLAGAFFGLVDLLAPAWDGFAGWLAAVVGGVGQFIIDNMGDPLGGLVGAFYGLVDTLQPAWDAFAGWLGAVLGGLPQFVADHIGDVWGALMAAFTGSTPGTTTGGTPGGVPAPVPVDGQPGDAGSSWQTISAGFQLFASAMPDMIVLLNVIAEGIGNLVTVTSQGIQAQIANGRQADTGPVVSIGTLVIASQEQADAFLDLVAQAVLASTRRVSPPVTGANPVLG